MPSPASVPQQPPTSTCTCTCTHTPETHYLVRCGCRNTRSPKDPLAHMDDAFHRVWCTTCLAFCRHGASPACPSNRPRPDTSTHGVQYAVIYVIRWLLGMNLGILCWRILPQ